MRKYRRARLVLAALLATAIPLLAHWPEYSPFTPAQRPKAFPVKKLVELGDDPGRLDFLEKGRTRQSRNPIARITRTGVDGGIDLAMLTWDGKRIVGPSRVSFSPVTPNGYSADVNRDGSRTTFS